MEEGQRVQIPLNSNLSSETNDMFQSVDSPSLTFNRQKYQGGYLPTSLRFEMNGWASGKWGYDYEVEAASSVVDTAGMLSLTVTKQYTYLAPIYTVTDESRGVSFQLYNVSEVIKWLDKKPTITRLSPTSIQISGETSDNNIPYTFYITQGTDGVPEFDYTRDWEGVDKNAGETISYDAARQLYTFTVFDSDYNFTDSITLYFGTNLTIGSDTYSYAFREGVHYWGEYVKIPVERLESGKYEDISTGAGAELNEYNSDGSQVEVSVTAADPNTLTLSYFLHLSVTDTITWSTEEQLVNITFLSISVNHSYFDDNTSSSNNRWFYYNITEEAQEAYEEGGGTVNLTAYYQVVRVEVPMWANFAIRLDTSNTNCGYPTVTASSGLFGQTFDGIEVALASMTYEQGTDYTDTSAFVHKQVVVPVTLYKDQNATEPLYCIDAEGEGWAEDGLATAEDAFNTTEGIDSSSYTEVDEFNVQTAPGGEGTTSAPARMTTTFTDTEWASLSGFLINSAAGQRDRAWSAGFIGTVEYTEGSGAETAYVVASTVTLPFDRTDWDSDYFSAAHIEVTKPTSPSTTPTVTKTERVEEYWIADYYWNETDPNPTHYAGEESEIITYEDEVIDYEDSMSNEIATSTNYRYPVMQELVATSEDGYGANYRSIAYCPGLGIFCRVGISTSNSHQVLTQYSTDGTTWTQGPSITAKAGYYLSGDYGTGTYSSLARPQIEATNSKFYILLKASSFPASLTVGKNFTWCAADLYSGSPMDGWNLYDRTTGSITSTGGESTSGTTVINGYVLGAIGPYSDGSGIVRVYSQETITIIVSGGGTATTTYSLVNSIISGVGTAFTASSSTSDNSATFSLNTCACYAADSGRLYFSTSVAPGDDYSAGTYYYDGSSVVKLSTTYFTTAIDTDGTGYMGVGGNYLYYSQSGATFSSKQIVSSSYFGTYSSYDICWDSVRERYYFTSARTDASGMGSFDMAWFTDSTLSKLELDYNSDNSLNTVNSLEGLYGYQGVAAGGGYVIASGTFNSYVHTSVVTPYLYSYNTSVVADMSREYLETQIGLTYHSDVSPKYYSYVPTAEGKSWESEVLNATVPVYVITPTSACALLRKRVFESVQASMKAVYTVEEDKTFSYSITLDIYFPVIYSFNYTLVDTKVTPNTTLLEAAVVQEYSSTGFTWTSVTSSTGNVTDFLQAMFPEDSGVDYTEVNYGTMVSGANRLAPLSYCSYVGLPVYVNDIAVVGFDYHSDSDDELEALDLKSSGMFTVYNSDTSVEYPAALIQAYKESDSGRLLWTDYPAFSGTVDLSLSLGSYYPVNLGDWSDVVQMFEITAEEGAYFYKMSSDEVVPYFISAGSTQYTTSTADATRVTLGSSLGTEILTHWSISAIDWITSGTAVSTHDYYHGLSCITDSDADTIDTTTLGDFNRTAYNSATESFILDPFGSYNSNYTYYELVGGEYRVAEVTGSSYTADTYYLKHFYPLEVTHIDSDFNYSIVLRITDKTATQSGTTWEGVEGGFAELEVEKSDVWTDTEKTAEHFTYSYVDYSSANSPYITITRSGYYAAELTTRYSKTVDVEESRVSTVERVAGDRYTLGYNWEDSNEEFKEVINYNSSTNSLTNDIYSATITAWVEGESASISIEGTDFDKAQFSISSVLNPTGLTTTAMTDTTLTFDVDGTETSVAIADILNAKSYLNVTALDIEQSVSEVEGEVIQSIDMDAEYTVVKQGWDTEVTTKDFYWLDATHYLKLTDTKVIIYSKLSEVSDWDGDKWEVEESISRAELVSSETLQWGVSSTYGTTALTAGESIFYALEVISDNQFRIRLYKPLTWGLELEDSVENTITLNVREWGNNLVVDYTQPTLNSYEHITAYQLAHDSKVTATHVGSKLIMSFHLDNALKQWTLIFNYSDCSFESVIHGMGYVGPDGSLTGGQWPDEFFDTDLGFNSSVKEISELEDFKTDDIESFSLYGCYGNSVQQWYIAQNIKRVVSHMTFDESTNQYSTIYLPLSSKYTAKYASTSFYVNKLTGFAPQASTLQDMLPFDINGISTVLKTLLKVANPPIWYIVPTWTKMGFLQQSLGQYAYVYQTTSESNTGINIEAIKNVDSSSTDNTPLAHTNSAAEGLKAFDKNADVLARDNLSFDKQEIEQTIDESENAQSSLGGFWLAIMTQGVAAVAESFRNTVQVNATQNQTTGFKDKAKAFTQFAIENALTAASTDIGMTACSNISLASKVTAVKTLDMFYSTSANNNSYFGPGYVCHQLVGQCVAQSVSNRFIQGNQYGMFTVLTPLTTLVLTLENKILGVTANITRNLKNNLVAGNNKGVWTAFGGGFANISGLILASAAAVLESTLETVVETNNFFIECLPEIIECLAPTGPQFSNPGSISSHNIDIEAKHKYGNKHCTFMWPCFNSVSTQFTEETVQATTKDTTTYVNWRDLPMTSVASQYKAKGTKDFSAGIKIENITDTLNSEFVEELKGDITSRYIYCFGTSNINHNLPADMAVVEGTTTFLPSSAFKNENIDATSSFTTPPIQDYMWSDQWKVGVTAGMGGVIWVSVKDTKVIDGECSNVIITPSTCLLASPYCALEVKRGVDTDYIRPTAQTPTTLSWNLTGYNICYNDEMYHGFDGVGYRVTEWHGSNGMDSEQLAFVYNFQENDHLKRSNILPPNQFFGNFRSMPSVGIEALDPVYLQYEVDAWNIGTTNMSPYEDRTQTRYAIPVFVEPISTLPTVVKALSSYKLDVYEGITALTTDVRATQGEYKTPESQDFIINKQVYRATEEYICLVNATGLAAGDVVAKLGMTFIGATPTQAFFYSEATRAYYSFTGSNVITKQDVWNRFKDITSGKWDFVNQEVVFECLGNMTRLYDNTSDTDADNLDNLFIAHLGDEGVDGDITPPNKTIFTGVAKSEGGSWFKTYSFSGGLTYQGPNRFIVNRFICLDYMLPDIVENKGKWKRVSKDEFYPFRKYEEDFSNVTERVEGVRGWTHNPFLFCTSPMGVSIETDCLYEWEITFTWTDEMDALYNTNNYACVNIMAQTMCEGGKKRSDVTHLYLKKDLFTRGDNSGYYSLRFQSRNGAGNREQLFIWSDAYIAMSGLQLEYKVVTERRQSQLAVTNVEIKEMEEF